MPDSDVAWLARIIAGRHQRRPQESQPKFVTSFVTGVVASMSRHENRHGTETAR